MENLNKPATQFSCVYLRFNWNPKNRTEDDEQQPIGNELPPFT